MIRTNSKEARENIKKYIVSNFSPENYGREIKEFESFKDIAAYIYKCFKSEKYNGINDIRYYHYNEYKAFFDWCSGLPSLLDTCYFYNRSAKEDVEQILEETETEAEKYSETEAENLLTKLIYNTIKREA